MIHHGQNTPVTLTGTGAGRNEVRRGSPARWDTRKMERQEDRAAPPAGAAGSPAGRLGQPGECVDELVP